MQFQIKRLPLGFIINLTLLGGLTAFSALAGIAIGPFALIPLVGGIVMTLGLYRRREWARRTVAIVSALVMLTFVPMLIFFYITRPSPEYFTQNLPWFIFVAASVWFLRYFGRQEVRDLFTN
jgi:hypothetical protein